MKTNIMIGGAVKHKKTIVSYFLKNSHELKNLEVTVYDGFDNCSWNGGRINRQISSDNMSVYYKLGINIALTFSNSVVDLNDDIGLKLLKKFHKKGNKIILINEELRKFIRKNYPLYELIYSITGTGDLNIPLQDSDIKKYKELEEKYDYIVPRMEHIFDNKFLMLDQSKYEIMLNDTCVYNCPLYKEHFEAIASKNKIKNPWTVNKNECLKVEECWINDFDPNTGDKKIKLKYGDNYGMDLNSRQLKILKNRGINSFKIIGRENKSDELLIEMQNYLKDLYVLSK